MPDRRQQDTLLDLRNRLTAAAWRAEDDAKSALTRHDQWECEGVAEGYGRAIDAVDDTLRRLT